MELLKNVWEFFTTKFRNKLLVALLGVSLVPLVGMAYALYMIASDATMTQAKNQLEAVRTIKSNQVGAYFKQIENQIATFAEDRMVVDSLSSFRQMFRDVGTDNAYKPEDIERMRKDLWTYYSNEFSGEFKKRTDRMPEVENVFNKLDAQSIMLQYNYVKANPNPLGNKHKMDRANDQSRFSSLHEKVHPILRNYLEKFGYYDIFLVDSQTGDVVYTCFKELDFTTSLIDGPYANTGLGEAFRKANTRAKGEAVLVDYKAYFPSYEDAASFIGCPVFDGNERIGVALFQMPIAEINKIMAERTGLGATGETYAVGKDFLFRNDSYFLQDLNMKTTIINGKLPVRTEAALAAFQGISGVKEIKNYRGREVLSSWAPATVYAGTNSDESITWALLSEVELAEIKVPIHRIASLALFIAVSATAFVIVVSYMFSRSVTKQTDAISNMLSSIGIGDFDARADVVSSDELGAVATAINAMCDNTLTLIQSREERDQLENSVRDLQQEVTNIAGGDLTSEAPVAKDVTGNIGSSINHMVTQLREIVSNVKDATLQVGASANQIKTTTEHLSRGSEAQATQIVDTSAAIEEMATSIQQVAESTVKSSDIATRARDVAGKGAKAVRDTIEGMERIRTQSQDTSKRIKRLGESSQEVGEIVQLISDIADRTSILALNASIQAAMAGDAGQGFAVVAEEVERLAERCNDATKQIATLIKAIQGETAEAIAGMEENTKEVVEGSKLAMQAGQRLEEIDSVSQELADLIQTISLAAKQQARGAEALSKSMNEISDVTQQTASGTKQAAVSASHLAELAAGLGSSVSRFKLPGQSRMDVASHAAPQMAAWTWNPQSTVGAGR